MGIFTPRKKRRNPPRPGETSGHITVANWLDRRGHFWHHSPMGGKRAKKDANLLKLMGARAGIPDFLIFTPPPCGGFVGTAMEYKREDGGDGGSSEQKSTLLKFKAVGWATNIVSGDREAIGWLMQLGY